MRSLRRYVCANDKKNNRCTINSGEVATISTYMWLDKYIRILHVQCTVKGDIKLCKKCFVTDYCANILANTLYYFDDSHLYFTEKNVKLCAYIDPYDFARGDFLEVYVMCAVAKTE